MSRIPYPDLSKKSARVREICDALPINLTRMLANASEGVFEGFRAFGAAFFHNDLPEDLREIGTLRAGYVAGSDYETWQHESAAQGQPTRYDYRYQLASQDHNCTFPHFLFWP